MEIGNSADDSTDIESEQKTRIRYSNLCRRELLLTDNSCKLGKLSTKLNTRTSIKVLSSMRLDRKSTRLNSSHVSISYAVFCLKKKTIRTRTIDTVVTQ